MIQAAIMACRKSGFRPLAGNGLGNLNTDGGDLATVAEFPSPCGEWVGKDWAALRLYVEPDHVSVPLRGMGWESLALAYPLSVSVGVSVPLRGMGWESILSQLLQRKCVLPFPSPCGEWVGKDGSNSSNKRKHLVSVPLRGMGWESYMRMEPHTLPFYGKFPSPCGEWVGKAPKKKQALVLLRA